MFALSEVYLDLWLKCLDYCSLTVIKIVILRFTDPGESILADYE